jgi:formate hydrogenlyase subunit 3/multisubunit Na+/H+ antiporter MnhD subunit
LTFREGYFDRISVTGILATILLLIVFLWVVWSTPLDVAGVSKFSSEFVKVESNIGQISSRYLWRSRTLDVIAQAILLFAAAVCCMAMLRHEWRSSS